MAEGLYLVGSGLDGRFLQIDPRFCRMGFDESDMIEQKLVAPRSSELAFFEKHPQLRSGPVVIVGHGFHNDRHLVRGISLESHVFERRFVRTRARTFGDGPLDHVLRHTFLARLFQCRREP